MIMIIIFMIMIMIMRIMKMEDQMGWPYDSFDCKLFFQASGLDKTLTPFPFLLSVQFKLYLPCIISFLSLWRFWQKLNKLSLSPISSCCFCAAIFSLPHLRVWQNSGTLNLSKLMPSIYRPLLLWCDITGLQVFLWHANTHTHKHMQTHTHTQTQRTFVWG